MQCPKCSGEIGNSTYCGCGWRKGEKKEPDPNFALGYQRCEWVSDGLRCKYPASLTHSTHGSGPWYCRLHFECGSASYGASVVQASRDYRHPTREELDAEHQAQAEAKCEALGLHTVEQRRRWVKAQVNRLADRMRPDYLKETSDEN